MRHILVSVQKDKDPASPYPGLSTGYCMALANAGLVPLLASCAPAEQQAAACDALLLTGGGDLTPEFYAYHLPMTALSFDDPARDRQELALFHAFLAAGKPVFGICRGMQLINAALGGTLWEDLVTECGNSAHTGGAGHEILLSADSALRGVLPERCVVNSFHHQACRVLAPGLVSDAVSADGILEAFHHRTLPLYGVQWHPERMAGDMDALFRFWRGIVEKHAEREKNERKPEGF